MLEKSVPSFEFKLPLFSPNADLNSLFHRYKRVIIHGDMWWTQIYYHAAVYGNEVTVIKSDNDVEIFGADNEFVKRNIMLDRACRLLFKMNVGKNYVTKLEALKDKTYEDFVSISNLQKT